MKIDRLQENIRLLPSDVVRVKDMGNVVELFYMSARSSGCQITKIDQDTYIVNATGEVKEFEHNTSRADDLKSVAKSLSHGRDIINTNVKDPSYCRWVTLTYRENMTDPKKLCKDFEHCVSRLRKIFGHFEYITAAEPQGRGAWHLHVLFIFSHKAPYMANEVVANAWKRGFVTVKKLDDVDNVGAYLTAYLGDMELDDFAKEFPSVDTVHLKEIEVENENGEKVLKRYVKGARLRMYPPQFHIFRWSKGIKQPSVSYMSNKEAEKKVSAATLTFEKSLTLTDPDTDFESLLNYRYYNSKRSQKSQE